MLLLQVAGDERPFAGPLPYGRSISQVQTMAPGPSPSNACKIHHKSLPDLHTSPNRTSSSDRYCEFVLGVGFFSLKHKKY